MSYAKKFSLTGDDGSTNWGSVMETKKFDEFVSDIFFDEAVDDNVMVASSGEGKELTNSRVLSIDSAFVLQAFSFVAKYKWKKEYLFW